MMKWVIERNAFEQYIKLSIVSLSVWQSSMGKICDTKIQKLTLSESKALYLRTPIIKHFVQGINTE